MLHSSAVTAPRPLSLHELQDIGIRDLQGANWSSSRSRTGSAAGHRRKHENSLANCAAFHLFVQLVTSNI